MANFLGNKFNSIKEAYTQWRSPKQEGSVFETPEPTVVSGKPESAESVEGNSDQLAEAQIAKLEEKVADVSIATEKQLDTDMEAADSPESKQKIVGLKEQAIVAAKNTLYKISEQLGSNRGV